ncbi:LysE family transporter [Actinotalea sp. Marseille-Q4924]|uniref:LysE family transporter n=1 Tax=Actinotalea sp. Marseille-Q4924 TaxID=2866571 RepID=UPI001CE405F0|nr:LysE family transporter [Actinotalea sp. Marseille-Q4924]
MDTVLTASALGAVVGLGIAIPLGAIGVLLLQTGMTAGWRTAAAGGLGAATVDLTYAAVAVATGTAVAGALAVHARTVQVLGAAVLALVAARGVLGLVRGASAADAAAVDPTAVPAVAPARTFGRFVGLTAVNPLTVVYFVAVAAGLADRLGTPPAAVAFVLGIGVASAAWQLALAGAGAVLGARVSPRVRTGLSLAGYAVVGAFAVALAVP